MVCYYVMRHTFIIHMYYFTYWTTFAHDISYMKVHIKNGPSHKKVPHMTPLSYTYWYLLVLVQIKDTALCIVS